MSAKRHKELSVYPDTEDVRQTMCKLTGVPRPGAEDIWPTVVLTRGFLFNAYQWCYSRGRHKYVLASELLQQAEKFIGRKVTPYEFCLTFFLALPTGCGSSRMPYSFPVNVAEFDTLKIKFPPLHSIEEMPWKRYQLIHEQEIRTEQGVMAQRRVWFGKGEHNVSGSVVNDSKEI